MDKKAILIVDDSAELRKILSLYMRNGGFWVLEAEDGFQALQLLEEQSVDLAILDVMMPRMDGFELVQKIRQSSNLPILFLSARDQVSDRITGLTLGADDYIAKPFDPMEVLARVNALLRRANLPAQKTIFGPLRWEKELNRVWLDDQELELTAKEYEILTLLMGYPRKIFTREEIFERVWREEFLADDNVIMVHISNLRDKLGTHREMLRTVRGLGYSLEKSSSE